MQPATNHSTTYWHALADGRVQCDLCPRECQLKEGQRGLCFVRQAEAGRVVLNSYGRSSGFVIDPVEKKPLYHFLPGSPILSFGTAGCNLSCKFCQNWDLSKAREMDRMQDRASPQQIARAARATGCRSVAYTYNDPVIFLEYALDVAEACRAEGVRSVAVTAGYIQGAAREAFFAGMDAANVDLKGFSESFYRRLCGGHLEPVLDTLRYLRQQTTMWLELTTLLIPGENDSDAELDAMTGWIVEALGPGVPLHFSAFHPDYKLVTRPPTPLSTLQRARQIALRNGVRHVYIGNLHDREGSSTYCHHCGARLIGREGYRISQCSVTDQGRCSGCGTPCAGVFDGPAGEWGGRRLPINMANYRQE
jgi:pyruvate formate lyase activating enzyme